MILKGQNFRILVYDTTASKFKCVGMATSCQITQGTNTDDGGTKDDVGMSAKPTVVSKSWQVQVDSLNVADAGAGEGADGVLEERDARDFDQCLGTVVGEWAQAGAETRG